MLTYEFGQLLGGMQKNEAENIVGNKIQHSELPAIHGNNDQSGEKSNSKVNEAVNLLIPSERKNSEADENRAIRIHDASSRPITDSNMISN